MVGYHNNNDYELISNGTLVDTNLVRYHIVVQYGTTNVPQVQIELKHISMGKVTSWGTSSCTTQNFGTYFGDKQQNLQLGKLMVVVLLQERERERERERMVSWQILIMLTVLSKHAFCLVKQITTNMEMGIYRFTRHNRIKIKSTKN